MKTQQNNTNTENAESPKSVKTDVALREEEILKSWKENQIFEKTLKQDAPKGEYVFYDGPPFANGEPHYGHILASTIKDTVARYKTMQGYNVPRKWGWDCHGLPVENLVEKELGLKSKKDIEIFGLEKFNETARDSVMRYADLWRKQIPRFGRFVDMENDYRTMDTTYTESVWWVFSELHKKGLIYEGFKSMHLCPHCGTTLSNFEVAQGYKDITDISVYAKFRLAKSIKQKVESKEEYILAWTTTPWTLPGNVALAVGKDIDYVKIKAKSIKPASTKDSSLGGHKAESEEKEEIYILAKSRLEAVMKDKEYEIVEEIKGKDLIGLEYEPLFDYYSKDDKLKNRENGWKIYGADFVTTEDGTGIVHIAPAFGDDDLKLGQRENLPFVQHVGVDGKFKHHVHDFAGIPVKPKEDSQSGDVTIIKYLAGKGTLFEKEKFIHSYPHCWRCDTPLLNYASSSWFVKVTEIKDKLVSANSHVNWIPADIKEGRFGKWLEGARDWAISRTRFWGAPLPIWKCEDEKCNKQFVAGSIEDIKNKTKANNEYIIMRHGEAGNNVDYVINGKDRNKYHLTEKGKNQVSKAGKKLIGNGIDYIICSPFLRTKETAEIVANEIGLSKNKIITEERLHEMDGGIFEGKSVTEYHNFLEGIDRFKKTPEGGESHMQIVKRMSSVILDLEKKYNKKKILIVTHEGPAWLLMTVAQGMSQEQAAGMYSVGEFLPNAEFRNLNYRHLPVNREGLIDLHRPYIDEVKLYCECGKEMKRIPDVFDCWFESGSMPYGQFHYPFENKDKFDPKGGLFKKAKGFPAEFIAEGLDQTRGWFYSMMVLGVALFGKSPYKNVIVNGIITAEDGQKMSKRLKNYPDPMAMVDKYGMDAVRFYMLSSPVVSAEDLRFSEKGVDEVLKKNINRLDNVLSFYKMYGQEGGELKAENGEPENVLDIWIIARLNETILEMEAGFEEYKLDKASRPIALFIDDLSTWYLRRSRDRFKGDDLQDKSSALKTTRFVLENFAKAIAPITPFYADYLYKQIRGEKESVHLEDWPRIAKSIKQKAESEIIEEMQEVRKIVSLGMEARMKAGIKVRQPLLKLKAKSIKLKDKTELIQLIKDEVNVKEVEFNEKLATEVELDTEITPELKEEGNVRDLIRTIQEMRKENGFSVSQRPNLFISINDEAVKFINRNINEIKAGASLDEIIFSNSIDNGQEVKVENFVFKVLLNL